MATAIYARQSIERKDSVSIESQIEQCKLLASDDVVVYKDAGYSGKNTNRPGFESMINDIKSRKIDKVISYRLDRVSRSITDFANLLTFFEENKVSYVSSTEQFDTSSPMGRAMIYIVMVFAQLERETIATRIADNYRYRSKLGGYMGGNTPFGYDKKKIELDGKKISILTPNENAAILIKIFDMFTSKDSIYSIVHSLNEANTLTSKGNLWTDNAVKRVIKNIAPCPADKDTYNYLDAMGYQIVNSWDDFDGDFGMWILFKNKDKNKETKIPEQSAVIGLHKPLISSSQWIKAQGILNEMSKAKTAKPSKRSFLAGLLKCGACGYSFGLKTTEKGGKTYAYYYCRSRLNRGVCTNDMYVSAEELENAIVKDCKVYLDSLLPSSLKSNADKKIETSKISDIQAQIDNLISNIGKGNTVVDNLLTAKITSLQSQLVEERAEQIRKIVPNQISHDTIKDMRKQFERFDEIDMTAKIKLIRSIVKYVNIDAEGNIDVKYLF